MRKKNAIVKAVNPLPLDTKEAGKKLVQASEEFYSKKKQERIVESTTQLMRQREEATVNRDWCQAVIDFLDDKLKALRSGAWIYDPNTNMITFNNHRLNNTQPEDKKPYARGGIGGRV